MKTRVLAGICTAALSGMAAPSLAQSIRPIFPEPPFNWSEPRAMSADGTTVVGVLRDRFTAGFVGGFRWTSTGTAFIQGPPASSSVYGIDISSDGATLLGGCTINGVNNVPFLSQDGQISAVTAIRNVNALSSNGRFIVGEGGSGGLPQAASWSAQTGVVFLPSLGDRGCFAYDVNHTGSVVVGITQFGPGDGRFRATEWVNGGPRILSSAEWSDAQAVNGDGSVIVGYEIAGVSMPIQAMRWTSDGGAIDMGNFPNGHSPTPTCVSADGRVVGGSAGTVPYTGTAGWIWTAETGMVEITQYVTARGVGLTGWYLGPVRDVSMDGMVISGDGAYLGQSMGYVVDLRRDSDGDSLYDDWEINGIPYLDAAGAVQRYPLPGALPLRKDLFVEVDSMPGYMMPQGAIDRVRAAFDQAPVTVNAPGGIPGVALWVTRDDENVPSGAFTSFHGWTEFHAYKASYFGTEADRSHPDRDARLRARALAYRYCMSVETIPGSSGELLGVGEMGGGPAQGPRVGGNDFQLAMANYTPPPGVTMEDTYAATFMHELGHTLGLFHGGGSEDQNYNPNHYSVMNYLWAGAREYAPVGYRTLLDYSREELPPLDKAALHESTPIGTPQTPAVLVPYFVRSPNGAPPCLPSTPPNPLGRCVLAVSGDVCVNYALYSGAVDWNNDGVIAPPGESVCANPNNGLMLTAPDFVMRGANEWSLLAFNFRDSPLFQDGAIDHSIPDCPTIAQELFLSTLPPAPPPPPCGTPVAGDPTPGTAVYCQAGGASFDLHPTGSGPFHVQWRRFDAATSGWINLENGTMTAGTQVEGAHAPRLTITNARASDFGGGGFARLSYTMIDSCGQVAASGESVLDVRAASVTPSSPTHVVACPGGTATLSVDIDPPGNYTVEWLSPNINLREDIPLFYGTVVSGIHTPTLTLSNINPDDFSNENYEIICRVHNTCDLSLSPSFTFSAKGLAVSTGPSSVGLDCTGGDATMTVTAVGPGPISYQWSRNGVPLSDGGRVTGATAAALSLTPALAEDAGQYRCTVSGQCAQRDSDLIALNVGAPVIWPNPPSTAFACLGDTGTLSVLVAGAQPCTYQWSRDGVDLTDGAEYSGTQTADLNILDVQPSDYGMYSVRVENACGAASAQAASLSSPPAALFDPQPAWARSCSNEIVKLSIGVVFPGDASIYWQRADANGIWTNLNDGRLRDGTARCGQVSRTNDSLTLEIDWDEAAGCFTHYTLRAAVQTDCGDWFYSNPVVIDRLPPSDFNGDGDAGTDADIEAFFACLGGNCCPTCGSVDYNNDGDIGTDADIESFFRVLGGGGC